MNKTQVQHLPLGLYRIYWKSGGSSLASVGQTEDGSRWLAPINWVKPSTDPKVWKKVEKAVCLWVGGA